MLRFWSFFAPKINFVMHKHIMYYTQSTVCHSGSYERNSSNTFLSSSPWAYVGFAKGELNFLGGWASGMPRSSLRLVA